MAVENEELLIGNIVSEVIRVMNVRYKLNIHNQSIFPIRFSGECFDGA